MATWLPQHWEPSFDAPARAGRQGGGYGAYLPDPLQGRPLAMGGDISGRAGWSQPVEAIELARRSVKTSAGVR